VGATWTGTRDALIVATTTHDDPELRRLAAPAGDALELASVLERADIGGFTVDTVLNAASGTAAERIEAFLSQERRPEDTVLLYFTGHGLKDERGRLYFAMTNTRRDRMMATSVSAEFVNELLSRVRARTQVLILDCCFSGAFLRELGSKGADTGTGVYEQLGGTGRVVLTSSDAMELSFETPKGGNGATRSLFTNALVDGLRTGEADVDGDGLVSIDDIYDYVDRQVSESNQAQRPRKWSDVSGDIYLARTPAGAAAPAPVKPVARGAVAKPDVPVARTSPIAAALEKRVPALAAAVALLLIVSVVAVVRHRSKPEVQLANVAGTSEDTTTVAVGSASAAGGVHSGVGPSSNGAAGGNKAAATPTCRNGLLGYELALPDGMREPDAPGTFVACEAFEFADSPKGKYAGQSLLTVPVLFTKVQGTLDELKDMAADDGDLKDARPATVAGQSARVVETDQVADPSSDRGLRKTGFRTYSYFVPVGPSVLVAHMVSARTDSPDVYARQKRSLDELMSSLKTSAGSCRNQVSFHCGDFFYATDPPPNQPGTATVTKMTPQQPAAGDEVTLTVAVSDPDANSFGVTCLSFGDPNRSGCALAMTGSASLLEHVRGRSGKASPAGPWDTPGRHPGSATFLCRHTYAAPGDFTFVATFRSSATGDDIAPGHDPFASSFNNQAYTVHVGPAANGASATTTTLQQGARSDCSRA
jgi:hypothetical protein